MGSQKALSPRMVISNKQAVTFWRDGENTWPFWGWWKVKWPPTVQKRSRIDLIHLENVYLFGKKLWFYYGFLLKTPVWTLTFTVLDNRRVYTWKVDFLMVNLFGRYTKLSHGLTKYFDNPGDILILGGGHTQRIIMIHWQKLWTRNL